MTTEEIKQYAFTLKQRCEKEEKRSAHSYDIGMKDVGDVAKGKAEALRTVRLELLGKTRKRGL